MTIASSSHDELETAFRSLYACNSKELRDLSMRSVDLASTRHLTALQGQTTDLMAQRVSEVSAQVESILSQRHAELHRVTQLTTSLESQKTHLEEESARITASIEALRGDATKRRALLKSSTSAAAAQLVVESNRSQGDATTGGAATKDASLVRSQRAELVSDLRYYTWLLRNLADLSDEELQTADLGDAACVLEGWTDTVPDVERRIDAIERNATGSSRPSLSVDSTCWSSEELRTQWEAVRRARSVQEARLLTECTRRHEKNQNVHGFLLEQAKMLQWCREQTTQLENLQQADHVQEFCASLQNNNATMDANFLVLGEMAEALLPHAAVQKGITDVSRAWFQLQVYTYERLRQCLLDQHMDAKLEDTLRAWSNYFYPVKEYFHTVEGLLLQPTEDEAVAFLTPLLESVRTLQNESVPHQLIVDHLADFSLRMQCIQENYNALRPSIFSSLSVLYPALAVHTSVQHAAWGRRAEYNQKVSDLADWMDVNGQAEIWEGLSQRIDRVRSAVEEERTETA